MSKKLSAKELSVNQDKIRLTAENGNLIVNTVGEDGTLTPITSTSLRSQEISSLAQRSSNVIARNTAMSRNGTYGLVVSSVQTGADSQQQTFTLTGRTFVSTPIVTATLEGQSNDPTYDVSISEVKETSESGVYEATFEFSDNLSAQSSDGNTASYKLNILAVVDGEDSDLDGNPDHIDLDDDNDGFPDTMEETVGTDPKDSSSSPPDSDGDLLPDAIDPDDDNDGVLDADDAFQFDPDEWLDTDNDGTGNNADTDDDGDNYTDIDEIQKGSNPLDALSTPDFVFGAFYKGTEASYTELTGEDIPITYMENYRTLWRSYGGQARFLQRTHTKHGWNAIGLGINHNFARNVGANRAEFRPEWGPRFKLSSGLHNVYYTGSSARNWVSVNNADFTVTSSSTLSNGDLQYTPRGWANLYESSDNYTINLVKITESGNTFPTNNNIQWTSEIYDPEHFRYQDGGPNLWNFNYRQHYIGGGYTTSRYYPATLTFTAEDDFIYYQPQMPDLTNWGSNAFANAWTFELKHNYGGNNIDYRRFLIKDGQTHINTSNWGTDGTLRYSDIYETSTSSPFKVKFERWDASNHHADFENSWLLSNDGTELTYYAGNTPTRSTRPQTSLDINRGVGGSYLQIAAGSESGNDALQIIPENLSYPFREPQALDYRIRGYTHMITSQNIAVTSRNNNPARDPDTTSEWTLVGSAADNPNNPTWDNTLNYAQGSTVEFEDNVYTAPAEVINKLRDTPHADKFYVEQGTRKIKPPTSWSFDNDLNSAIAPNS